MEKKENSKQPNKKGSLGISWRRGKLGNSEDAEHLP